MKLFHISDLHLGKRVYEFSMLEEQQELLEEILQHIDTQKPDALLISGDIYDKPVPPTEAVRLLDYFLTALAQRELPTYLIAGNHDSAQRLDFGKTLFDQSGIHIIGTPAAQLQRFTQQDTFGEVNFWLMPFFKPAQLQSLLGKEEGFTYQSAAEALLAEANIDFSQRNVILVHQFVTWKGTAERSDSETLSLGGVEEIDAGLFFPFEYAALGHLHRPQSMGKKTVRYAGSPMPYSFSEIRYQKGITVVNLQEKGQVSIELLPLSTTRKLREIKGPLAALLAAGREAGGSEDYIRCILTDEAAVLDPVGQLRAVYPNLMTLEWEERKKIETGVQLLGEEELQPEALFSLFFKKQNEKQIDAKQQKVLHSIWNGLEETP